MTLMPPARACRNKQALLPWSSYDRKYAAAPKLQLLMTSKAAPRLALLRSAGKNWVPKLWHTAEALAAGTNPV